MTYGNCTRQRVIGARSVTLVLTMGALLGASALTAPSTLAKSYDRHDRVRSCRDLSKLDLRDVTITTAEEVTSPRTFTDIAGAATVNVPFCRVAATITPVPGSEIGFEVWLPPKGDWNGKFQGVGSGGSNGAISYPAMNLALTDGYATMATDNGHKGGGTYPVDPETGEYLAEKVKDFGYRAQHLSTVAAKKIIQAMYRRPPKYSYFVGCSQGGHHALMEAQRYPEDYDGIVAGNPALDWNNLMIMQLWNSRANLGGVGDTVSAFGTTVEEARPKITLLNQAVIQACDANDGLVDGLVDAPLSCEFDPEVLRCEAGDGPDCLTGAQIEVAKKIWSGPLNPRTGEQIHPGEPLSSEMSWLNLWVGRPTVGGSAGDYFPYTVMGVPTYDFRTFDFDRDVEITRTKRVAGKSLDYIMNATNPDLRKFKNRGGKLIMYSGWADGFVTPIRAVDYYEEVVDRIESRLSRGKGEGKTHGLEQGARRKTEDFFRFFMAPGMGHCAGGPGFNAFGGPFQLPPISESPRHDVVSALEAWVEEGRAPNRIDAAQYVDNDFSKGIAATRPICVWPKRALYDGEGDVNDAANYSCADQGNN